MSPSQGADLTRRVKWLGAVAALKADGAIAWRSTRLLSSSAADKMTTTNHAIVYGVKCLWWDSIDKAESKIIGKKHVVPCCPYCNSVLMEIPSIGDWWKHVRKFEDKGNAGYGELIEWMRGKCFPTIRAASDAWKSSKISN